MSKTSLPIIFVVLGLPTKPVSALITRATAIVNAMTAGGKMFPSPPIALPTVTSDISALASAEVDTKTRTAGMVTIRDGKLAIVVADVHQLHGYVQQVANASPAQAAEIPQACRCGRWVPATRAILR